MRRMEMMTAGAVTMAGLGALAALAIGWGEGGKKLIAQRTQPVEVRTEIIRKTVNVYRREHPHHAAGSSTPGRGSSGTLPAGASAAASLATRTRASGARGVAPTSYATPVVSTRSSGSKAASGSAPAGGSGSQSVKTRSSGASSSGGGSGSSRPVSTRASGGGDGHNGGHDD
jgi:hypothetical protein